jgi:hypothetical protein
MALVLSFWIHPSDPSFTSFDVGGIFTPAHLVLNVFLSVFGYMFYRFLISMTDQNRNKAYVLIAILLIGFELLRMGWNVFASDGWNANAVWPLYTCGIFVIVFPFYAFKSRYQRHVEGFIGLGAMLSGIAFLIFPSTGLAMFPLWHINTFISTIMHWIMAIIGAVFFFDRKNPFTLFDIITSTSIILGFVLVSWLYNTIDSTTNFFFIAKPITNTPLTWLYDWFGQPGYGIAVVTFHLLVGVSMFFIHRRWIQKA